MSSNPPERPTLDGVITVQDIQQELNFIEHLTNVVSGTDDYLEAMVENQRLQLMAMLQQNSSAANVGLVTFGVVEAGDPILDQYNVDVNPVPQSELLTQQNLPLASVGITNTRIYENDTGYSTFQLGGTVFSEKVRATEDIPAGTPIRVVAPGNIVEEQSNVATSFIGLSGRLSPEAFQVDETDQNVTVQPGEREVILNVPLPDDSAWYATGTNDETFAEYYYLVDGEEMFDEPLKSPYGLYNDPEPFPTPIRADQSISVEVALDSAASSSKEFYSKFLFSEG